MSQVIHEFPNKLDFDHIINSIGQISNDNIAICVWFQVKRHCSDISLVEVVPSHCEITFQILGQMQVRRKPLASPLLSAPGKRRLFQHPTRSERQATKPGRTSWAQFRWPVADIPECPVQTRGGCSRWDSEMWVNAKKVMQFARLSHAALAPHIFTSEYCQCESAPHLFSFANLSPHTFSPLPLLAYRPDLEARRRVSPQGERVCWQPRLWYNASSSSISMQISLPKAKKSFPQYYPKPGWHEHEIQLVCDRVIEQAVAKLEEIGYKRSSVKVMDREMSYQPAQDDCRVEPEDRQAIIVWEDSRTCGVVAHYAHVLKTQGIEVDGRVRSGLDGAQGLKEIVRHSPGVFTGLPLSTYFSAIKLRWMINNWADVRRAHESDDLAGRVLDCIYRIYSAAWDPVLLRFFGFQESVLPRLVSTSEMYGNVTYGALKGVPLGGLVGDQQGALVGNKCLTQGEAKSCTDYSTTVRVALTPLSHVLPRSSAA
ncbi:hypothetical protein BGW80DRAFT_1250625 [Lactifluus volemus]|nr:hypothetical protein BGW80DRAFT_1250625 [Lactifluus volemus]